MYPETEQLIRDMSAGQIWSRYVRYIGAGAVATAGIITLIRSLPMMVESFRVGAGQLRARIAPGSDGSSGRTDRDLPFRAVGAGVLIIVLVLALVPVPFATLGAVAARAVAAVCVVVFAFFFVTVASRIVGLVGVTSNPTSGMTIASLLGTAGVFLVLGWTDLSGKAAALTVGCVVAIAASSATVTAIAAPTATSLPEAAASAVVVVEPVCVAVADKDPLSSNSPPSPITALASLSAYEMPIAPPTDVVPPATPAVASVVIR